MVMNNKEIKRVRYELSKNKIKHLIMLLKGYGYNRNAIEKDIAKLLDACFKGE